MHASFRMHSKPIRRCRLAAFALTIAPVAMASAQTQGVAETRRWVPAVGVTLGISAWDSEASVASTVRPSASGSELLFDPLASGTLELATPGIAGLVGTPRLFGHADIGVAFAFAYDVAKEGAPGKLAAPTENTLEEFLLGQGSRTRIEWKDLVVGTGIGVAFTVAVGEWRFRIKPSVEYLRQELEASGVVNRAISLEPGNTNGTTNFRLIEIRGNRSHAYHSVGAGLEFEIDAARFGPTLMSVFASGQAYAALGNRSIDFAGSYTDASGTETANWHFEPAAWFYRGALGFRFRWLPEHSPENPGFSD